MMMLLRMNLDLVETETKHPIGRGPLEFQWPSDLIDGKGEGVNFGTFCGCTHNMN